MIGLNFTTQDILGAAAAFFIFPIVILFPGYVLGWALDLFNFHNRLSSVKLGIGLILSISIVPVMLDLTARWLSIRISVLILAVVALAFLAILIMGKPALSGGWRQPGILWLGLIAWVFFVILSLINIQKGDQLYITGVTDQSTRALIIDAITRTGVPAANPGFFPGRPALLTALFYFWYLPCSIVDMIGGQFVDARAALNASSIWAGFGLVAMIGLYLRSRNTVRGSLVWKLARIGAGLLLVSGLDFLLFLLFPERLAGLTGGTTQYERLQFLLVAWRNLEYNILNLMGQWVGSLLWVPHHIAGMIAGLTAVLLAHSARGQRPYAQFRILAVAGLALASAVGLSTWVALVFVLFWCLWIIVLFLRKEQPSLVLAMIGSGVVALLVASPFLLAVMSGAGSGGQTSIGFGLRNPAWLASLATSLPPALWPLAVLIALPFGYFAELGFFFAGLIWFMKGKWRSIGSAPFKAQEVLLLSVVLFIVVFARSFFGSREIYDVGWRGWLPGQFILLVWAVDLLHHFTQEQSLNQPARMRLLFGALIAVGLATTIANAVFLRLSMPVIAGEEAGRRMYAARLAYDYLHRNVPQKIIAQYNPAIFYDDAAGLFGSHQMVISDLTSYGVPENTYSKLQNDFSSVFSSALAANWRAIDRVCLRRSVGVLIVSDTDPLWGNLPVLKLTRPPLYENSHFALYACGDYSGN